VDLVTEHGKTISSTRIRRLLSHGELEEVREILGRRPSAAGLVVAGDQRGRTLGVPTANIDVEAGTIFPGRGVYAARVLVDGIWYRAAVNIGHNPTFRSKAVETTHVTVEAFLLDFSGDIYERPIHVDFLHKLRDEHRFDSVAELVTQMRRDIAETAGLEDPAFAAVGLAAAAAL
jgi:riboflavin kinase/FMN adenylyltransferase